jgi:hypothetical protein
VTALLTHPTSHPPSFTRNEMKKKVGTHPDGPCVGPNSIDRQLIWMCARSFIFRVGWKLFCFELDSDFV